MLTPSDIKQLFLLDPEIAFLNHGSFGATPRPVFAAYQDWQRRMEAQPVRFFTQELPQHDRWARDQLATYLHASPNDLAFISNATFGVNLIARSLSLGEGDEILTTDHEYGACDYTWELICRKTGARYVRQHLPLPIESPEAMVEAIWQAFTPRTRVVYLSHITSATALRLPVEAVCQRARENGVISVIDGAHAPGQIPLDLEAVGADVYIGNLHKWFMAPKGAAFIYTIPERQLLVEPLVVSWGYHATPETTSGSTYIDYLQWQGTKDHSASLAVPAAIQFQHEYDWNTVRGRCRSMVIQAIESITSLTGLPLLYPTDSRFIQQMAVAPLPAGTHLPALKQRLWDEHRVEVPLTEWQDRKLIRVSIQGYNSQADVDRLLAALHTLLPQVQAAASQS